MMKKRLTIFLCLLVPVITWGQTVINRIYPVKAGQHLMLKFDHPVVRISTWDKNEVSIIAKVNINDGDNNDAFILKDEIIDGALQISDQIKDLDKLPHHYTIKQEGKKTVFKTKADFEAYKSKAGDISSYSNGIDVDIKLEIKVPANTPTDIKATYGMVELVNFHAPANVDVIYGGIDATVDKTRAGQVKATTSYGKIYSNLDLELTDKTQKDFLTSITAEPGKGPAYIFKSTYGKIYMRKP